ERRARVDRQARLAEPMTRPDRRLGARGRRLAEPEGRVGVSDVLFGPGRVTVRRHLRRAVGFGAPGWGPVFSLNPVGHRTAGCAPERLGGPPPGLVRPGLAAADDLVEHGRRPNVTPGNPARSSWSGRAEAHP